MSKLKAGETVSFRPRGHSMNLILDEFRNYSFMVKSRDWNEILEFYRKLDNSPMSALVEQIITSRYILGIFAATSMHSLCISQNSEFERDRNMLRIEYFNNKFEFTYKESPYSKNGWRKECNEYEGFSTFEHVMSRLKWFLE